MLATKPKPKKKLASFAWKTGKLIAIPIAKHDHPPLNYITASVRLLRRPLGWHWRIELNTPLYKDGDPDADRRRPTKSQEEAVLLACDHILRILRADMDVRIQHRQTAIAGVEAKALHDIGHFRDFLKETGVYAKVPPATGPSLVKAVHEKARSQKLHADIESVSTPFDFCSLHKKPETAVVAAKRSDVPAVIDVPSAPAEKLSGEERKTLSHCEKTIKQGARAFLETGHALTLIQEKRLYREKYSTFEAYLWEEFHVEKSVAYRWIKAAGTHTKASAIAKRLNLSITNEAQLRALETVIEPQDMQAVLKRAARKITPNADGLRVPTAKILSEARREEFTSPEDLKHLNRQADEKRRMRDAKQEPSQEKYPAGDPTQWRQALAAPEPAAEDDKLESALKDATFITPLDGGVPRRTLAQIADWREWLARQLLDDRLTAREAAGICAYHPTIKDEWAQHAQPPQAPAPHPVGDDVVAELTDALIAALKKDCTRIRDGYCWAVADREAAEVDGEFSPTRLAEAAIAFFHRRSPAPTPEGEK